MFSELPGSVTWYLAFGGNFVLVSIFLLFLFLLSFWHLCYSVISFVVVQRPQIFWIFFSLSFSSLCFSVLEISIEIASSSNILFSAVSSLLISPSKALFSSVTVVLFFISRFFSPDFGSLLEFPSLCLYYPSVLACYLLY